MQPTPKKIFDRGLLNTFIEELEKESHITCNYSNFKNSGAYITTVRMRRVEVKYHELFLRFKAEFGGYAEVSKKDGAFWYNLSSRRAFNLVEQIPLHLLVNKKRHVELVNEMGKRLEKYRMHGKSLPPKEHEGRREIIAELRRLNSRAKQD